MHQKVSTALGILARFGRRPHGIVTRKQLLAAGLSPDQVRRLLSEGLLNREYRGVYRLGPPSPEARYLAAVRACGDGAILSGRAAAHLLGLTKGQPPPPEVTAPAERRVPGLKTRRPRRLDPPDATTCSGIPVTTVPRTIVDLAAELPFDDLARLCHEAGVRYRTRPRQVKAVLARIPNARGAGRLEPILTGDSRVTLSRLEDRFQELLEEADLPLPVTNKPAGAHRVDCRWPEVRLTVELDSYTFHHSRHAWEQDRRREREARARGDEFRRYTWGDVYEEPQPMLADLRRVLAPLRALGGKGCT